MAQQPPATGSQTLSRGIRILEVLAEHGDGRSVADLADELGLHKSIVYRLVRTLEAHGLVSRDEQGLVALGYRLAALAAGVERDLQQVSIPHLRAAADELEATCFLVGYAHGEVTTLVSTPPRRSVVAVAQNPGTRHPLGIGAPGRAVLAQLPPTEWPAGLTADQRLKTTEVLADGFAVSHDEVIAGLHAVAVPLIVRGRVPLALGAVRLALTEPPHGIAERLRVAGEAITAELAA